MGPHLAVLTTIAFFSWFGGIWQRSLETINVTGFFEPCLAGDPESCYWLLLKWYPPSSAAQGFIDSPGPKHQLRGWMLHRGPILGDAYNTGTNHERISNLEAYISDIEAHFLPLWLCIGLIFPEQPCKHVALSKKKQDSQEMDIRRIKNPRVTRLPQEAELLVPRFPCAHRPSRRFSSSWSLLRPEAFVAAITHMGSLNSARETLSANFGEGSSANSKSNKIRLRLETDPSRPTPMLLPMFRA